MIGISLRRRKLVPGEAKAASTWPIGRHPPMPSNIPPFLAASQAAQCNIQLLHSDVRGNYQRMGNVRIGGADTRREESGSGAKFQFHSHRRHNQDQTVTRSPHCRSQEPVTSQAPGTSSHDAGAPDRAKAGARTAVAAAATPPRNPYSSRRPDLQSLESHPPS
ncbi:hypothetical protein BU26DRAFT_63359 [Trematosphaeria pertusa]|uniref:Uncharacterized protein n=1 Tax=Trematosphaeria pertusa TaxID=390896 RepID=A0A6A6I7U0_9PLEO|nr:uncharacterized protein BU26DRAFT_63359 [Trematosphaeria pertusa]KAF2246148.1 hypothetical protein BU26DRAFT_63359 [Trematosphaeria pertusa]